MVHLSEWPLRECFYNVYSDKLDHQRASESFWSKYFHVWISEGFAFFNQDRNEHWIFSISIEFEFCLVSLRSCLIYQEQVFWSGSPLRAAAVPRLPCVRHPLIMLAFPSTFSATKNLGQVFFEMIAPIFLQLNIFPIEIKERKRRKKRERGLIWK